MTPPDRDAHDDDGLARLMTNLAGHDMGSVLDAFHAVTDDRPTCFIAYTIKGFGLPFAGHKDNHAGLMTPDQMAGFAPQGIGVRGPRMGQVRRPRACARGDAGFPRKVPFAAEGRRRLERAARCRSRRARDARAAAHVDPAGLRAPLERACPLQGARSPTASSPPRPTSPSRPISAPGSTGAACSPAIAARTSSTR